MVSGGAIIRRIFDPTGLLPGLAPGPGETGETIGGLFTGRGDEPQFRTQPEDIAGIPTTRIGGTGGVSTTGSGIESQIAQYETTTGAKFLGQLPDGSLVFVDPLGEQFRLVNANGVLTDPSLLDGGTGGGGGGASSRFLFPEEQQQISLQNQLLQRELATNPNLTLIQDERTGQTLILDTQTGESRPAGQFGFAQIDPERQFGLQEAGVTGFIDGQPTLERELGTAAEDRLRANLELQRQVSQGQLNLSAADQDRLRRQIEVDVQAVNQQADFGRFDRARDILKTPSDFLARAALSRGVESPTGEVTQADLINALREQIRDVEAPQFKLGVEDIFQRNQLAPLDFSLFSGGQTAAPTPAPAPAPTPAPSPLPTTSLPNPANVVEGQPSIFSAQGTELFPVSGDPTRAIDTSGIFADQIASGSMPTQEQLRSALLAGLGAQGFREGGADVMSPVIRVGESVGGKPNPEFIFKRPGDPMVVVPERMLRRERRADGREVLMPGADDVIMPGERMPGAQSGGIFGLTGFQTTQDELRDLEEQFRPPAVDAAFTGAPIPGFRLQNLTLPTPSALAALNPSERAASRTTVAAQEGITLEDLEHQVNRQFGPTRQRGRATLVPGFR